MQPAHNLPPEEEPARPGNEHNAFDGIRLLLALLVVYTHAVLLGGFGPEGFSQLVRGQTGAGTLAVLGFFGLSGFLVTHSFVTCQDWGLFVRARLLRIMPGLWLALVLTTMVLAPVISSLNAASSGWYFADAMRYVGGNALVKSGQWNVGGILSGLPYAESLNGSLWSLFPELCCYALVLGLGLAGALQRARANLLGFLAMVLVLHVALVLGPPQDNLAPTLLSLTGWTPFVAAFLVGSVMSAYRAELGLGGRPAVWWWAVVVVLLKFGGWALLGPVVLPAALIHTAHAFRLRLPADLSYGIYVLHFPVLQLFAAAGLNRHGFAAYLAASLAVTIILAAFSWYAVEKPALRLKRKKT